MLDLAYAYPFQRERYLRYWERPLPIRDDLRVQAVSNGYALTS